MTDIVVTAAPGSAGQSVAGVSGKHVTLSTPQVSQGVAFNDDGMGWAVLDGGLARSFDVSSSLLLRQVVTGNVTARVDTGEAAGGGGSGQTSGSGLVANTVCLLGDSMLRDNGYGETTSESWNSRGHFVWANYLLRGRLKCLLNAGVSGQTTAQVLSRVGDVIAKSPGWCIYHAGTNDARLGIDAQTAIANISSTVSALRAANIKVLLLTVPPQNGITPDQHQVVFAINKFLHSFARETPGVYISDIASTTFDPSTNGEAVAGMTRDGLHPTPLAAGSRWGVAIFKTLDPLIPKADLLADGFGTDNLLSDPFFRGSGSAVPPAFGDNGGGAISYVSRTDGLFPGNWMQVAVPNGSGHQVITNISIGSKLAVGDIVYAVAELEVDSIETNPSGLNQNVEIYLQAFDGSNFIASAHSANWQTADDGAGSYGNCPCPGNGVLTTSPLLVPAGTQIVQLVFIQRGGGNFRWGRAAVRKGTP